MEMADTPRRVLHVVSAMNRGGTETLLMNVYRNIDRSKIQFDFISHRKETCDYDEEIKSLGGNIFKIPSLGQDGPLKYLKNLRKIMVNNQYNAVHCHTDFQSGFPALAAKMVGIKRRICHSHTNKWSYEKGWKEKILLSLFQSVIQFSATQYCACSVESAEFLFGKRNVENGNVQILKNGINVREFLSRQDGTPLKVKEELNIPNDAKIIGHVGSFSNIKNQSFILSILSELLKQEKNVVCILVGDGNTKSLIEEEVKKRNLIENVKFLGVREDIPRLMKAFDVFLFPSLYEGFGMVAIEAQCTGTPCIVSDTVPKTTDMGLNLITYLSLQDDTNRWIQEIRNAFSITSPKDTTIHQHFSKLGYDIQANVNHWLSLYGV
ncbi:MAG: glycosyltransferase family 1 protein [Heyndrickxia sp.]